MTRNFESAACLLKCFRFLNLGAWYFCTLSLVRLTFSSVAFGVLVISSDEALYLRPMTNDVIAVTI